MYITYEPEIRDLICALNNLALLESIEISLVLCIELSKSQVLEGFGNLRINIEFHSWLDYSSLDSLLEKCDAFFVPMSFDKKKRDLMMWGMPGKIVKYLKIGRPIIVYAPKYSSIYELAAQYSFGPIVCRKDPKSIDIALKKIIKHDVDMHIWKAGAQCCIRERYSLEDIQGRVWESLKISLERQRY